MRDVEAIVLVGGRGTRLRPLTDTCPKPMLPVAGIPLIERQLIRLRAAGVRSVVLATSYQAETFRDAYGSGEGLGLALAYSFEESPLGTGGAIREAWGHLSGRVRDVVVLNGDIISKHDLASQVRHHRDKGADVTLHTRHVDLADAPRFGTIVSRDGRVEAFLEKQEQPVSTLINAGCYVFRSSVLGRLPVGEVISVERDTFPNLIESGANVRNYDEQAYWIDVGTLESYQRANDDLGGEGLVA